MQSDLLTPRETIILRRLLVHKGITEYELVGVTSTGTILPGGLYEREIEAVQGYAVTATSCYHFVLCLGPWAYSFGNLNYFFGKTLGGDEPSLQRGAPETVDCFEHILRAQRQLQQRQPAPNVVMPSISYHDHEQSSYATLTLQQRLEGSAVPLWPGPVWRHKQRATVAQERLVPQREVCMGLAQGVGEIAFSPDGSLLLTNADHFPEQVIQVWHIEKRSLLTQLDSEQET